MCLMYRLLMDALRTVRRRPDGARALLLAGGPDPPGRLHREPGPAADHDLALGPRPAPVRRPGTGGRGPGADSADRARSDRRGAGPAASSGGGRAARRPGADGERRGLVGAAVAIALGTLVWPVVTGIALGRWDAYTQTQRAWATVAGNRPDTWLGSLWHGAPAGRWVVVLLVVGLLVVAAWRASSWTVGIRAWTVAYPLLILAVTPPTASVIRFSVLAGAVWWPAPDAARRVTSTGPRVVIMARRRASSGSSSSGGGCGPTS